MPKALDVDQLNSRIIQTIAKTQRMDANGITADSTFDQLKIDSLDGINIIFALENEFGVEIPDEGLQNMRSVRQITEGIEKLLVTKSQAAAPGAR